MVTAVVLPVALQAAKGDGDPVDRRLRDASAGAVQLDHDPLAGQTSARVTGPASHVQGVDRGVHRRTARG